MLNDDKGSEKEEFMRWDRIGGKGKESVLAIGSGFPGGSVVKNPHANAGDTGDMGSIPGLGRTPGAGNGNPLSILVWEIPWTEEPGGLQSILSPKSDMT